MKCITCGIDEHADDRIFYKVISGRGENDVYQCKKCFDKMLPPASNFFKLNDEEGNI